ncbi:Smr/MutS family protein [Salegentibacter sp. F14]
MEFKPGDKVAALDDDLEGVVIRADLDWVTIETTEGFEMDFPPSELVKIDTPIEELPVDKDFNSLMEEKRPSKKQKTRRVKPKERNAPPMEVDLHIEKLVNNYKPMSNFDILNLQMETAKRQLEFAMRKRIQKLVFIHGVGEGVLKAELDYLLGRYDNLKFYDADYQKYGQGATEVYFYQKDLKG